MTAALLVIAFGTAYLIERPTRWTSTASVVLVPEQGEDQSAIIQAFGQSGTAGTVVEYLSGPGVSARAGNPDGDLVVRLVPDTRVIDLTFTGPFESTARDDLTAIVWAGLAGQDELGDPWTVRELAPPSAAERAGPSGLLVAGATLLVALLAALTVWVIPVRRPPTANGAVPEELGERDRRLAA